jgi:hypothetical protein
MAETISRRLVIDVCIAGAAGSKDGISIRCRTLLRKILAICHRLVMTDKLRQEWDKLPSKFALTWHRSMVERKKEFLPSESSTAEFEELWLNIQGVSKGKSQRAVMEKDFHLIEAALATDKIIISIDDEAREAFAYIA